MKRILIVFFLITLTSSLFISCSKEYSTESGLLRDTATGSLHDNLGNCYPSTVNGNYTAGVATGSSNYVELQVNVTKVGSYKIATSVANGFSLKDSGNFTAAGIQTIQLKSSGTPLAAGTTNFFVTFDTTTCTFAINVQSSGAPGTGTPGNTVNNTDSAWSFIEGGKTYHGYIDTAYTFDTTVFNQTYKLMQIQGSTATTGDSVLLMSIAFSGGIKTGNYSTTGFAGLRFLGSYNFNDTLYSANFQIPSVNTSINVLSYDASTQIIQGTFSGTAKNKSNATVNLLAGKFKAKLN